VIGRGDLVPGIGVKVVHVIGKEQRLGTAKAAFNVAPQFLGQVLHCGHVNFV
jgi:hypothetical protein